MSKKNEDIIKFINECKALLPKSNKTRNPPNKIKDQEENLNYID
ncbi:hypothetical protein LCGC14_0830520 [marine sediment metagenome]|uniref:Uncharacterized protein n=1 Tax=marine sediment metagenome TaxID=412755 RepID=A0A0F9Q1E3_9ZZZZ|nr:MAG: hypothetical protein Lokiarch_31130 [Candidatus Lokiarchaeum sp. GC14_75]